MGAQLNQHFKSIDYLIRSKFVKVFEGMHGNQQIKNYLAAHYLVIWVAHRRSLFTVLRYSGCSNMGPYSKFLMRVYSFGINIIEGKEMLASVLTRCLLVFALFAGSTSVAYTFSLLLRIYSGLEYIQILLPTAYGGIMS